MNRSQLRNSLTASLMQMYETEVISNLADFWQGELHILYYLVQHSAAEINPSLLSEALCVSRARITTALAALRKKGYLTLEICEEDRRKIRVRLTGDGESFIRQKQNAIEKHFDGLIEGLGEENVGELIRLIELAIKVMDKEACPI